MMSPGENRKKEGNSSRKKLMAGEASFNPTPRLDGE